MSRERYRDRRPPRPTYRAQFAGRIIFAFGQRQVVQCEPKIELRPLSERSELYGIFDAKTGKRLTSCAFNLREAKTAVSLLFHQQLTEWEEIQTC